MNRSERRAANRKLARANGKFLRDILGAFADEDPRLIDMQEGLSLSKSQVVAAVIEMLNNGNAKLEYDGESIALKLRAPEVFTCNS